MTNSEFVRQLDDRTLAKALIGGCINEYCTSPVATECPRTWDDELDCSPCEACIRRWLKQERRCEDAEHE